jgi:hypothetical protein
MMDKVNKCIKCHIRDYVITVDGNIEIPNDDQRGVFNTSLLDYSLKLDDSYEWYVLVLI